uniref:RUN and FYVE domain-containing protein 2-like n=1 Tax=Hirondellea gigas TaxID=1518452 RepID=A0A2P2I1Y6_9CRUS
MAASADPQHPFRDASSNNNSRESIFSTSFNSLSSGQWQIYISDKAPISSKPIWKERDPVSIERSNLVNICKLVVKELIESSLKSGRQLDSDSVPLQHFFIVLEHVLRHGLKPKRGLLGPKKELWDLFQLVERWSVEAQDITASVRDLPTVNTALGRARAWLRLALMQKKLSDYFRLLLERRDDLLVDFYEPGSLMLADESVVIMGLLVGLNVVDCNLCVKEEDLDSQMGVIDFSLYLRRGPASCSPGGEHPVPSCASDQDNLTTVLDQKNYIEELNRHLNATVSNLQARVESLTTTNALMKEDLAIARSNLTQLHDENESLRQDKGIPTAAAAAAHQKHADREAKRAARISVIGCEEELQDLKRNLDEESAHRKQVERELELQVQMKAESEMAAKLLEKDIHEKQDTIVSLRRQLEDIKIINLEMYQKLQECESSLRQKTELIGQLEEKTAEMAETIRQMETQYVSEDDVDRQACSGSSGVACTDKKSCGCGSNSCSGDCITFGDAGGGSENTGGRKLEESERALSCIESSVAVADKSFIEAKIDSVKEGMVRAQSCAEPITDVDLLSDLKDYSILGNIVVADGYGSGGPIARDFDLVSVSDSNTAIACSLEQVDESISNEQEQKISPQNPMIASETADLIKD